MKETTGRPLLGQSPEQLDRQSTLGRPHRFGIPLGAFAVDARYKGWLSPHGQANVARLKGLIDPSAELEDLRPLRIGIGTGDPRRFIETLDPHAVLELDLAFLDCAFDGRSAGRTGRRC